MTLNSIPDGPRHALDALAAMTAVGTIFQFLPPIAALLAIIWTSLQIFGWVEARIEKRRAAKNKL